MPELGRYWRCCQHHPVLAHNRIFTGLLGHLQYLCIVNIPPMLMKSAGHHSDVAPSSFTIWEQCIITSVRVNMPVCASTGPVLARNGMFTGVITIGFTNLHPGYRNYSSPHRTDIQQLQHLLLTASTLRPCPLSKYLLCRDLKATINLCKSYCNCRVSEGGY